MSGHVCIQSCHMHLITDGPTQQIKEKVLNLIERCVCTLQAQSATCTGWERSTGMTSRSSLGFRVLLYWGGYTEDWVMLAVYRAHLRSLDWISLDWIHLHGRAKTTHIACCGKHDSRDRSRSKWNLPHLYCGIACDTKFSTSVRVL